MNKTLHNLIDNESIKEYIAECSKSDPFPSIPDKIIVDPNALFQKPVQYLVTMGDLIHTNTTSIPLDILISNYWFAAACGSAETLLKLSNILREGVYLEKNVHFSQILMIAALDRGYDPMNNGVTTLENFTCDEIRLGIEISHFTRNNLERYEKVTPTLAALLLEQFNAILKVNDYTEPTLEPSLLGAIQEGETENTNCCSIL